MTKTLALGVGLWYLHPAAKAGPACRIKAQIVYVYATDLPHDIVNQRLKVLRLCTIEDLSWAFGTIDSDAVRAHAINMSIPNPNGQDNPNPSRDATRRKDFQWQEIREMLAQELRVTDKGLDPDYVIAFLEKAIGSSESAARLLEQFASLQKASRNMQNMITETSQLANQVKEQAKLEAEAARKQVIEAAKRKAEGIISEARSSCAMSIEDTNSILLHIKNKLEETLDQATKRCLDSVESTNLVFLEAVTMAKEMQEMAFQKAKEMALINMGAIREEIHNVVEATQRELNSALGQLTGGESEEPHLAADKEPHETELTSGQKDTPPAGPVQPEEPTGGLTPSESSEPHFGIGAVEEEETELKRSDVFPQAEEADVPEEADFGIGAVEEEEAELRRSDVFPQAEEADVPEEADFGIGAVEEEETELRRSDAFPQAEEADVPVEADYVDSDQNTPDKLPVMDRSGLEIEEEKQPGDREAQPSAGDEDASRLYQGEVILVIPQGARQSWIRVLRKQLLSTPNVYIRLESGGDERETMLTLLLTAPVALGSLLLTVPSVRMVAENGNGHEPSPRLKKRRDNGALSNQPRTLLRLVLDDSAVSGPSSEAGPAPTQNEFCY